MCGPFWAPHRGARLGSVKFLGSLNSQCTVLENVFVCVRERCVQTFWKIHLERFFIVEQEEQSQQFQPSVGYKSTPFLSSKNSGSFQIKETTEVSVMSSFPPSTPHLMAPFCL